jgi:hypothetical protein
VRDRSGGMTRLMLVRKEATLAVPARAVISQRKWVASSQLGRLLNLSNTALCDHVSRTNVNVGNKLMVGCLRFAAAGFNFGE